MSPSPSTEPPDTQPGLTRASDPARDHTTWLSGSLPAAGTEGGRWAVAL